METNTEAFCPDSQIRKKLSHLLSTRGKLREFCSANNLSYNYAYRVAKGSIVNLSHSKAIEISNALSSNEQSLSSQ